MSNWSVQVSGNDFDLEDGVVKVRLRGACAGCPMSQMTLKNGIEAVKKAKKIGTKTADIK